MIVLALDISTKSTGAAIFNDTELIHYTCLTATSTNVFNRIDKITDQIQQLIKKYKPTAVVVQDPLPAQSGHNMSVYKKLTWAQGIIGDLMNKYKLEFTYMFTSSQWRSKVGISTGRGIKRESLKSKDIAKVKELYNIEVNDDIADAILIGRAYTQQHCNIINWE